MFSKEELLQVVEQIEFLAQKDVLNIPFLTHNAAFNIVMQRPHKVNEIRFCVIFSMTVQELASLQGFGEKTAERLIKSLSAASMNVSFERFLRAAGLNKLSASACAIIAQNFKGYDEFKTSRTVDSLKLLERAGLDTNSIKVLIGKEFWDNAELLGRFVVIV